MKAKPIVRTVLEDVVRRLKLHSRAEDCLVAICTRADDHGAPVGSSVYSDEMRRLLPHLSPKIDEARTLLSREIEIRDGELIVHPYREPDSVAA